MDNKCEELRSIPIFMYSVIADIGPLWLRKIIYTRRIIKFKDYLSSCLFPFVKTEISIDEAVPLIKECIECNPSCKLKIVPYESIIYPSDIYPVIILPNMLAVYIGVNMNYDEFEIYVRYLNQEEPEGDNNESK
jgi:hypothetical protein